MKTLAAILLILGGMLHSFTAHCAAWQSRHNLTPAAYQTAFEDFHKQGYRVTSISGYTRNGQEFYEALWVKVSGPAMVARHAMNSQSYQTNFDEWYNKGYRITALSGFALNGQPRFAAIWEKKPGTWAGRHNLSADAYQNAYDDFGRKGYKLRQVCGYVINGKEYFAATWDKDTRGDIIARHNLSARQYQDAFDDYTSKGYVLTCVSGYTRSGIDLFAAIWEKKGSPQWFSRHAVPEISYQPVSDNMYYQGYMPVYLNAFASVSSAKYSAIWENTSMKGADLDRIDDAIGDYMKTQSVEGVSLAVCKDGKLVYAKAWGSADKSTGEALGPNHSMRIMSISKPVTACGIMKLWEQDNSILKKRVFGSGGILGSKYTTPSGQSDLNKIHCRAIALAHVRAPQLQWRRCVLGRVEDGRQCDEGAVRSRRHESRGYRRKIHLQQHRVFHPCAHHRKAQRAVVRKLYPEQTSDSLGRWQYDVRRPRRREAGR